MLGGVVAGPERLDVVQRGRHLLHEGLVRRIDGPGGPSPQHPADVAAHIAALNPPYAGIVDVPADVMQKEQGLVKAEMDADPKNASNTKEAAPRAWNPAIITKWRLIRRLAI